MNRVFFSIAIIFFAFLTGTTHAQDKSPGDVVIHSDARLATLIKKTHNNPTIAEAPKTEETGTNATGTPPIAPPGNVYHDKRIIYSGKGYRVQVYNGPDREKAAAIRAQVIRRFPGVSTYLMYIAPAFRVKVGDYRYRQEAEQMLREANAIYKPSMIVPDIVTVSTY